MFGQGAKVEVCSRSECLRYLVRAIKIALVALALFFMASTAYGIFLNYSAVPIWDMWNGYLEFYYRSWHEGGSLWWEQHNEHRLVLARLFFWVDIHFFKGNLIFLFILNFVFPALSFATFFWIFKQLQEGKSSLLLYSGAMLLAVFCFSWLQQENFIWAFQSQFHMAYLLPLWSFLLFVKAVACDKTLYFSGALLLGALSMMTMANGVLVLPVMILAGLFLGLRKGHLLVLLLVSIISLWLYFSSFHSIPFHPSMRDGLLHHSQASLLYLARYLSGPFYPLAVRYNLIAYLAGGFFLVACLYLAMRVWLSSSIQNKKRPLLIGLLAFLFFIGGTAVSTSLGRAVIGAEIPSRYMTPALLGWCSILILISYFNRSGFFRPLFMCLGMFIPLFILLPVQANSIRATESVHAHNTAAVALAMGVRDSQYLRYLYWDIERLFNISNMAKAERKSIFSQDYIQAIPPLGTALSQLVSEPCRFYVDQAPIVFDHPEYVRLQGWSFIPGLEQAPAWLVFGQDEQAVGYAMAGQRRVDVARALGTSKAQRSGFTGYLLTRALNGAQVKVYGYDKNNQLLCASILPQWN